MSRSIRRAAALAAAALALAAPAASAQATSAYFSNGLSAPQTQSHQAMLDFLSNDQPGFDLQSYPIYGSLIDRSGATYAFSTMVQRKNLDIASLPKLSMVVEGTMIDGGNGFTQAGVGGIPELTFPLSVTSSPWSVRSQSVAVGQLPQFVDMRVVEGRIGEPGAVYEITADAQGSLPSGAPAGPMKVYVRARDTIGFGYWGWGPSGFSPQWLFANQRDAVVNRFGGSLGNYLKATGDPMTNQGSYYYSSPGIVVEQFAIAVNGRVIARGRRGTLNMDLVTQTFDQSADTVVDNGVQWLEFTIMDPTHTQGFKVGEVSQASVGTLKYASGFHAGGPITKAGLRIPTSRWKMSDIGINPIAGSQWTSPRSGLTYDMRWKVTLFDKRRDHRGSMTMTAVHDDQEITVSGRSVYEGLFHVRGTIDGQPIDALAWAEIQAAGALD